MRCASVFIVRGFLVVRAWSGFEEGGLEKLDPKRDDDDVVISRLQRAYPGKVSVNVRNCECYIYIEFC